MKKEDLWGFIIDNLGFTLIYFLNSFFIILFYEFLTNGTVEILYPLLMSFSIYIIYMIFRSISYFEFIRALHGAKESINFNFSSLNYSRNLVFETLDSQFNSYMKDLSNVNLKIKNFKYFFSQWIHEMKTPISVIDLIIQNDNITNTDEMKKEILDESNRLTDNLHKALSFIRLEDFAKDFLPEKVNLKQSLVKIINKKRREFIYNRVFPQIICEDENLCILTDMKWNEYIIEQLTNNAIKYSKTENENKNVYYIVSKDNNKVYLTIKDEGMGIPEQDINRIFEPFFTGENGRKVPGASGMGLYLVREISNKLNQEISVHSIVKQGSKFTITYLSKL